MFNNNLKKRNDMGQIFSNLEACPGPSTPGASTLLKYAPPLLSTSRRPVVYPNPFPSDRFQKKEDLHVVAHNYAPPNICSCFSYHVYSLFEVKFLFLYVILKSF